MVITYAWCPQLCIKLCVHVCVSVLHIQLMDVQRRATLENMSGKKKTLLYHVIDKQLL